MLNCLNLLVHGVDKRLPLLLLYPLDANQSLALTTVYSTEEGNEKGNEF